MIEWQPLLQIVGLILIPIGGMIWGIHVAAVRARERLDAKMDVLDTKIGHVHGCVEVRSERLNEAMHRLEVRIAVIETRGMQNRRGDFTGPDHRAEEKP